MQAGQGQVDYPGKEQQLSDALVKNLKFLGQDGALLTAGNSGKTPPGQIKGGKGGKGGSENFQYYYHPDHLGSTSYVTDASGEVYQHLEYFAFGETFVEEHSNTNRTPYLYNGKELDEETGLYYYGARYYDPRTSIWQSVDPLAEKYPNLSPYAYVANSPIIAVDPDGMKIKWRRGDGVSSKELRQTKRGLRQLARSSTTANTIIKDLRKSPYLHTITITKKPYNPDKSNGETIPKSGSENISNRGDGSNVTFDLNDRKYDLEKLDIKIQQALVLGHELGHSWLIDKGLAKPKPKGEVDYSFPLDNFKIMKNNIHFNLVTEWQKNEEVTGSHIENMIRGEMDIPLREYYQPPTFNGSRWETIKPGYHYENNDIYQEFNVNP